MCPACGFAGVYPGWEVQVPWSVLGHGAGSVATSRQCEPCVGTKLCPVASGLRGLALEMSFWLPAPPAAWKWQRNVSKPLSSPRDLRGDG